MLPTLQSDKIRFAVCRSSESVAFKLTPENTAKNFRKFLPKPLRIPAQSASPVQWKNAVRLSALPSSGGVPGPLVESDGSVIIQDDMDAMIQVLPPRIRERVISHPHRSALLEVILDIGRRPEARFLGDLGSEILCEEEVTWEDLQAAEEAIGEFGGDNRAGVEGTLHRISAMRSRRGKVVGLTCRVGRAVTGHVDMISDVLEANQSILFLGRPGVGKTTVIREIARILSDEMKKRVVIVDTSNEIGGDGDVPHPAIGSARRMQVSDPSRQHQVMIEAVENHMPEVIIVDEVGTEAEALACRTIAERGVMLISTAHGQLLENLIKNPTLSDLVGGIQSVTLGDEEARARGTQKTVLERAHPPTFPLLIEMRARANWVLHWVEDSVDALLQGRSPTVQVRSRNPETKKVDVSQMRYSSEDDLGIESELSIAMDSLGDAADASDPIVRGSPAAQSNFANNIIGGFEDDQYAWAQRLRNIPDKDALSEMAMMGYISGDEADGLRRYSNSSLVNGTGSGKRGSRRRSGSRARASRAGR
mmetsp:Transcript_21011/g.50143  ORF Transcript_21011/g.50143 Transcript_21011/m.50143 type:complete len:534 (+) Transcript_21011:535-2136(+)